MSKESCDLPVGKTCGLKTVGDQIIENFYRLFCFFIFGVTQVIFYLGKMVYLEVFEVLGQDNKAAGELKIGKLSILNQNFGSSNLFLLLGNQLNQFFFGK